MKKIISRTIDHLLVPIYGIDQTMLALSLQGQREHRDWWKRRRSRVIELWDRGWRPR